MADYYPASSRFGLYSPGVIQGIVGGIPSRSGGNVIDATDYGLDEGETESNNATALTAACAAAVNGDVVTLPAGSFNVTALNPGLTTTNMSITVRGAGMNSTILHCSASAGVGIEASTDFGSVFNPSSTITAMARGSNVITVADGSGFPSPSSLDTYRLARISLVNELVTPIMAGRHYPVIRFFDVVMVSRSGNNITLAQPLPSAFTAGATGAVFELAHQLANQLRSGFGLEDLRIDGTVAGTMQYGVVIASHHQSWIKNVRIKGFINYGIRMYDCHGCEIRGCWSKGPGGTPTNNSGILTNTSSNLLIEHNIIVDSFPDVEMSQGTIQSVFGYNYCGNGQMIVNHGPWNSYNLFEGNTCDYLHSDGFFGGESENTFYRNRPGLLPILKRFSRNANVIGNVVFDPTRDGSEVMGYPNIGNSSHTGTAEFSTGDYWLDWDSGTGRPKTWSATLTTRSTTTTGVLTLGTGQGTSFAASIAQGGQGDRWITFDANTHGPIAGIFHVTDITGDVVTFTGWSQPDLPDVGETGTIEPGTDGFQEQDLDVINTMISLGNYRTHLAAIPSEEALGSYTLPDSYYLSGTPQEFTGASLAFPPYDPTDPSTNASGRIPAEALFLSEATPEVPEFTTSCSITGTPAERSVLTAVPGTVTGVPAPTITFQWQRAGVDIGGATASTYTPVLADVGTDVTCDFTATNSEGSDTDTADAGTITPFMGDIFILPQTANSSPVTDFICWAAPGGTPVDTVIHHSLDYPNLGGTIVDTLKVQVPEGIYERVGGKEVWTFDGTQSAADCRASF